MSAFLKLLFVYLSLVLKQYSFQFLKGLDLFKAFDISSELIRGSAVLVECDVLVYSLLYFF